MFFGGEASTYTWLMSAEAIKRLCKNETPPDWEPPRELRRRRRSKKDWRKHVAREIHRALKEGNPVPTADDLTQYCVDTIDYDPDSGDLHKLINQLLARLIA